MNQILLTPDMIQKHKEYFKVGYPEQRSLNQYIYKLDLEKWNFLLTDIVDIANFVSYHTTYTGDFEVWGVPEYWLQSVEDCEDLLRNKREDCDGLAVLMASLAHSVGRDDIRLCLGHYGEKKGQYYEGNHAWCMLWNDGEPKLIEVTGDNVQYSFDSVEETSLERGHPEYHTLMSANIDGVWAHGEFIQRFFS